MGVGVKLEETKHEGEIGWKFLAKARSKGTWSLICKMPLHIFSYHSGLFADEKKMDLKPEIWSIQDMAELPHALDESYHSWEGRWG